eukprot:TRINITY_DN1964_c0_g1_i5.p4 TRINITY_DN1964_c0_g1~~TRINITY_DN1964_c0_g1_i5.p4  ORF type:complete len:113 (+),score=2.88 TRINITY_DN1964_c0_g1_i5:209-547(+)
MEKFQYVSRLNRKILNSIIKQQTKATLALLRFKPFYNDQISSDQKKRIDRFLLQKAFLESSQYRLIDIYNIYLFFTISICCQKLICMLEGFEELQIQLKIVDRLWQWGKEIL